MLNTGIATKTIATSFALTAFTIAVVAGLMAGNPATHVLKIAIISMIGCHIIGVFVGMMSEHAISDYVAGYRRANPVPNVARELSKPPVASGEDV